MSKRQNGLQGQGMNSNTFEPENMLTQVFNSG